MQGAAAKHQILQLPPFGRLQGRIAAIGGLDGKGKRSACSFLFSVFGDDGFPFKTKIRTISRVAEVMQNWNATYNLDSFRQIVGDKRPSHQAMTDIGINKTIQRFVNAMDIRTPVSFFRDPKTTSFKMQTSKRFVGYYNGIKNLELDVLTTGYVTKAYDQGLLFCFLINTIHKQEAQKDGFHTEYHEGTSKKRATYTYKNGKMNGIYREYDTQGNQIMEAVILEFGKIKTLSVVELFQSPAL